MKNISVSTKSKTILVVLIIFFIISILAFSYLSTRKTVYISDGYQKIEVVVYGEKSVSEILKLSGVVLGENDECNRRIDERVCDLDEIVISYGIDDSVSNPSMYVMDEITEVEKLGNYIVTSSGEILKYSKVVKVTATAYCSCSICCGPYDGTSTADGSRPKEGYTVATPSTYKFGTFFYIPSFDKNGDDGIFEVEDRGGAIQGDRIDIYFSTHEKALKFGRRTLTVYVLEDFEVKN